MAGTLGSSSAQGGNQSFIPISAANTLGLGGGDAGPASANSLFGPSNFSDGAFQVGGVGNVASQPSAVTTTQGLTNPADMLPLGALGGSSSSSSMSWLLIAGAALVAWYFLRKHL